MAKKYSKTKEKSLKSPNPTGPSFRTPSRFKGGSSMASKKGLVATKRFFKVQHRG